MLHPLAGRPIIGHALALVGGVGAANPVVVLGHLAEQVQAALPPHVRTVIQAEQLGTGHAESLRPGVGWQRSGHIRSHAQPNTGIRRLFRDTGRPSRVRET